MREHDLAPLFPAMTDEEEDWAALSMDQQQRRIHQWAESCGWWVEGSGRERGAIYMNIASEVSEAWEAWRKRGKTDVYYVADRQTGVLKPEGAAIELADVVIRIQDFVEHEGYSLAQLIGRKMAYNMKRPYRHGGKHA